MPNGKISKAVVDDAQKGEKDYFIWDKKISGFGLKVTPSGGKIYVLQYRIAEPGRAERTPARRYTIGKHGQLTPDQARNRARELAGLVSRGIDPRELELDAAAAKVEAKRQAAEKARADGELAFENMATLFLDHYENEKDRRPSSVRLAKLVINNYLLPKLRGNPMPRIGRADLQSVLDAIPTKHRGMRRAVFAYSSVLFGWAAKRGDIVSNPLIEMSKPEAPKARDRVLSDVELKLIWRASETLGQPFGPFFRLLMATGQRRAEVAGMRWAELDRSTATWTIPADRAKNRKSHIVPISPLAVSELDELASGVDDEKGPEWPDGGIVLTTTGKTPISGFTMGKAALDTAIEKANGKALQDWRVHDIRRTVATGFQRLGIRFEVTEAVLNHISGSKAGVAGIYQRHDWADEKRNALHTWARHIEQLLTRIECSTVVALQGVVA